MRGPSVSPSDGASVQTSREGADMHLQIYIYIYIYTHTNIHDIYIYIYICMQDALARLDEDQPSRGRAERAVRPGVAALRYDMIQYSIISYHII